MFVFGPKSEYVSGGYIYINNPDAADAGFTVSLAASGGMYATFINDSGDNINYNTADCLNDRSGFRSGGGNVFYGGRMYVQPENANISSPALGEFNYPSLGSNSYFDYGVVDSITLVQADANTEDIADYVIDGINIYQTIPAMVPAGSYSMDMTLSIVADTDSVAPVVEW